ncbi:hypothetical protein DXG01_006635 [Tephrocybe rancida]|nr:hypothetical protein DXG01_006635 [Tephrocybe rancida]
MVNILFCVHEGGAGVILATIWSGFEWIILLILGLLTIAKIRRLERSDPLDTRTSETQPLLDVEAGQGKSDTQLVSKKKAIYFISYTLCTLSLVLSVDVHFPILFTVITFFLTAPHHIALYIASARPNSPFNLYPSIAHPASVAYAFFLCAIWLGFVILEILASNFVYQSILLGIFGGLECCIITYLAVHSVVDSFSEGQIKL